MRLLHKIYDTIPELIIMRTAIITLTLSLGQQTTKSSQKQDKYICKLSSKQKGTERLRSTNVGDEANKDREKMPHLEVSHGYTKCSKNNFNRRAGGKKER